MLKGKSEIITLENADENINIAYDEDEGEAIKQLQI